MAAAIRRNSALLLLQTVGSRYAAASDSRAFTEPRSDPDK